jgi:hypothetical protein
MYSIPILLIVFNRPECVEKLILAIAPIKPVTLFIAIDGPRSGNDLDLININKIKTVIDRLIDWDCKVKFKISNENQGVKMGPFNSIKWFFDNNEMGLVLEDDCIPDLSFFTFCQEMLERYSNDNRIGIISGRNDIEIRDSVESYFYSTSGSIWGWASWARVINNYDVNDVTYLENIKYNLLSSTLDSFQSKRLAYHLEWAIFDNYVINTWDYQLHAYLKLNYQLYVIPKVNLIQNIGFGQDASHTKSKEKRTNLLSKNLEFPLVHPRWIFPNRDLSKRIYRADSNSILIWWYLVIRFHIQNFFNKE